MDIIEMNASNCEEIIANTVRAQEDAFIMGVTDKVLVLGGDSNEVNIAYCQENNIPIKNIPNVGGCMVLNIGDVEIGYFTTNIQSNWHNEFMENFCKYLTNKRINAKMYGNDLLLDDTYKTASFSTRRLGNLLYIAVHISIDTLDELINNICLKPRNKIPKGLGQYGITTEEVVSFVKTYVNN